ncbi:hypothetical protein FH603_595 [Spirosoma sp. LMG 31447]|uniref:Uncharacterized protein n=1 Tax=Spirosoma utsteinense TaxID=2585773 RepID=A0ABR6W0H0_9BACT|nr:hypothetical protein [Spirosoma utsteinense]
MPPTNRGICSVEKKSLYVSRLTLPPTAFSLEGGSAD